MDEPKKLLKSGGWNLFYLEHGSDNGNDSNEVKTPNASRSAMDDYKDEVEDPGKVIKVECFLECYISCREFL